MENSKNYCPMHSECVSRIARLEEDVKEQRINHKSDIERIWKALDKKVDNEQLINTMKRVEAEMSDIKDAIMKFAGVHESINAIKENQETFRTEMKQDISNLTDKYIDTVTSLTAVKVKVNSNGKPEGSPSNIFGLIGTALKNKPLVWALTILLIIIAFKMITDWAGFTRLLEKIFT